MSITGRSLLTPPFYLHGAGKTFVRIPFEAKSPRNPILETIDYSTLELKLLAAYRKEVER